MEDVLTLPENQVATVESAEEVILKAGVPMERLTLKEFVQLHGFKSFIHQLRLTNYDTVLNKAKDENKPMVPFISFMMPNNKAKNIHFSKNAGIIFDSLGIQAYKDKLDLSSFDEVRFMWSETPSLDKYEGTTLVEKGYSWKVVSANSGESNRTEFNF